MHLYKASCPSSNLQFLPVIRALQSMTMLIVPEILLLAVILGELELQGGREILDELELVKMQEMSDRGELEMLEPLAV